MSDYEAAFERAVDAIRSARSAVLRRDVDREEALLVVRKMANERLDSIRHAREQAEADE